MSFTVTLPEAVLTKQFIEVLLFSVIYTLGIFTTRYIFNQGNGDGSPDLGDKIVTTFIWLISPIIVPVFAVILIVRNVGWLVGSIILLGKK